MLEGRAPWFLGPTGAAVDQAEVGARYPALVSSWKMTGVFQLPKKGPPACSKYGPVLRMDYGTFLGSEKPRGQTWEVLRVAGSMEKSRHRETRG